MPQGPADQLFYAVMGAPVDKCSICPTSVDAQMISCEEVGFACESIKTRIFKGGGGCDHSAVCMIRIRLVESWSYLNRNFTQRY